MKQCHLPAATSISKKKKKRTEKVQTMKKKKTLQRPFFSEEVMNNFLIHLINYQDYSE